ncbi:hypothetical protein [Paenibacillus odorifer]|uniref:REase associating with pPIWI RE domain-containing protein n=1 Tax=Paenibacillus odorifer TaxID=189426 RepID=A0A1R0Y5N6_9BACL|nr:hypothetical protein [Paenibacillus odorifer]OMD42670.1 hypothetical protein BSK52_07670 [Paenibacillus odorifer]
MAKTHDTLLFLIIGINKWQGNYGKIPDELYKGMLLFIEQTAASKAQPPVDLFHLLQVLHHPSREWGIPDLQDYYPEDAPLLEEFIGLTPDADEFLNRHISPQDAEQQYMYEILMYCREEDRQLQQDYTRIRTFLSNPYNAVITSFKLSEFAENFSDLHLTNLIKQCYEEITPVVANYRKCPHCGWTLEYKNDRWRCNKENICHLLADFESLSPLDFDKERVLRLLPGIQRFVLLPGMSEVRIAERLIRKGYEVELYPNVDEYDLSISQDGKRIFLDVKDFRDPRSLANFFNHQTPTYLEKYKNQCLIVVPQYRSELFASYRERSMALLNETAREYIKMIMENEIESTLKKVFL